MNEAQGATRVRSRYRDISKGVVCHCGDPLAGAPAQLPELYADLSGYFDPPLTRSVLLVASALFILVGSAGNLGLHFRRSWDMYAICGLALLSAAFSTMRRAH